MKIAVLQSSNWRSLLRNFFGVFGGRVLTLASSFFLARGISEVGGTTLFGMWAVCSHLIASAGIFDLGLSLGIQNAVSHCQSDEEKKHAESEIRGAFTILIAIGLIVVIIGAAISLAMPDFSHQIFGVSTSPQFHSQSIFMSLICTIVLGTSLPFQVPGKILAGVQKQGIVSTIHGVTSVILSVKFAAIANFSSPLWALFTVVYVPQIATFVYCTFAAIKLGYGKYLQPSLAIGGSGKLLSQGGYIFLSQLAGIAIFQVDIMIVSWKFGAFATAQYEVSGKILGLVSIIQGIILIPIWPSIAQAWGRKDYHWITYLFKRGRWFFFAALIPIPLILSIYCNDIAKLWLNLSLDIDKRLVFGFALFVIGNLWGSLHAITLNAIGETGLAAKGSLFQAFFNLVGVFTAANFGYWIIPWVSAGVGLCTTGWYFPYAVKRKLKLVQIQSNKRLP